MKQGSLIRIRVIGVFFTIIAVVLLSKLYLVQIVHGDFFYEKADRQYSYNGTKLLNRGEILFSEKDGTPLSAASLKTGAILSINPKNLQNPEEVYNKIVAVYPDLNRDDFLAKAAKKNDPYEEVQKHITEETGQKLSALKIPGVIVEKERWRYYPGKNLAAQTIGFMAFKGDTMTGRYGLERYYNDTLTKDDEGAYKNFFSQLFSGITTVLKGKHVEESGDLLLTIEPNVERMFTDTLRKTKETYNAEEAAGIIMNPKTGEIYAMTVLPDFDLNDFSAESDVSVFNNSLVESVHEMGSIIKPLTMAAGLDTRAVTPETTYDDKGKLTLDGKTIANFDGKGRGVVPMQEVLSQSLNTGVAFVVSKLGNKRFADYMKNYGLGEETGIDLPGEIPGLIKNLDSTRDIEYATASFGQGIALTPIATVRALASLGNGGRLVTPHLVKEIRYDSGLSHNVTYEDTKQVISKETSETITRMLVNVVDKALLHGKVKLEHYSVAAKTGTAQVAKEGGGGYYEDRYLHSFFGYFPAYDPQFIVFMYLYYPKNVAFASETLTMPFSDITKYLINYYQIPPDR